MGTWISIPGVVDTISLVGRAADFTDHVEVGEENLGVWFDSF